MDVTLKLQAHINQLFQNAGAPDSRAVYELKEELLANSIERYSDLTAKGMGGEEAFQSVASSIGNVDELVAALPPDIAAAELVEVQAARRQRSALVVAAAVGMYILAALVVMVGQVFFYAPWLQAVGIAICIVPTCLLVYNGIAYPKYKKGDDTIVEEFKQYSNDAKRFTAIKGSVSVIIWMLTLALYFVISFATGAWYITWVMFFIGGCLQAAATLLFSLKGM